MIKWGIIGAGRISEKFASDFQVVKDAKIVAVAARELNSAQTFAQKHNIAKAYGNYEQLAADPEVDVIYIGTTHNFHFEHTMLCFKQNKHVLCEKPVTVNATQFKTLTEEAARRNLFLMEAMWTPFLPPIIKALEWIAQGKIGHVQLIKADLGFVLNSNPEARLYNPALAGGALLDVGIYP
jgi:dihydrodiol dehydrogenase / D-xylose 1-dehydrogenase (NADP)